MIYKKMMSLKSLNEAGVAILNFSKYGIMIVQIAINKVCLIYS